MPHIQQSTNNNFMNNLAGELCWNAIKSGDFLGKWSVEWCGNFNSTNSIECRLFRWPWFADECTVCVCVQVWVWNKAKYLPIDCATKASKWAGQKHSSANRAAPMEHRNIFEQVISKKARSEESTIEISSNSCRPARVGRCEGAVCR